MTKELENVYATPEPCSNSLRVCQIVMRDTACKALQGLIVQSRRIWLSGGAQCRAPPARPPDPSPSEAARLSRAKLQHNPPAHGMLVFRKGQQVSPSGVPCARGRQTDRLDPSSAPGGNSPSRTMVDQVHQS